MAEARFPWRIYGSVLLALLALTYLAHGTLRLADPDEYQVLINAAYAARGFTPYVEYWDNHGPLMIWLLRPVLGLWSGGHELILWMRAAMWVNTALLAAGVFWFTRYISAGQRLPAWIAVLFLLSAPPFLSKAIELRVDNPANLLAFSSIVSLSIDLQTRRPALFMAAGVALGLLAGFTLKFLIVAVALAGFLAAWCACSRSLPNIRHIALLLFGAAVPIGIYALILAVHGALGGFLGSYLSGNVTREVGGISFIELEDIYKYAPFWALWATAVLGVSLWKIITRGCCRTQAGLIVFVIIILGQFIVLLPTKHLQSLLVIYPPLAVLTGVSTASWIRRARWKSEGRDRIVYVAAMAVPLLLARDMANFSNLKNRELPKEVRFANQVLALTADEPYIFDPSGIVFLKARPGPFPVYVTFIRQMHQAGTIDLQIPETLTGSGVQSLVFDRRAKDLRSSDVQFMMKHYSPVLRGRNCWLMKTDSQSQSLTTDDLARWQEWQDAIYDKATTPTESLNKPEWFTQFSPD